MRVVKYNAEREKINKENRYFLFVIMGSSIVSALALIFTAVITALK